MESQNTETHHLLPSGEWVGFYCYGHSPEQHKMLIEITFRDGLVFGSGVDNVAPFIWKGDYKLKELETKIIKSYLTHQILYKGDIDENGIWGIWEHVVDLNKNLGPVAIQKFKEVFKDKLRGGFHIWPKKNKKEVREATEEVAMAESLKLKEIYIERLELIETRI